MKFKKIFLITLLLSAFLMLSAVSANDNLTDEGALQDAPSEEIKLEDANDGIVSSSQKDMISEKDNGTFTALQNKIDNAGDGATIYLENDYAFTSNDKDSLKTGIFIDAYAIGSKTLTIDGKGHIIDGSRAARIFTITNQASVVLKNMTLTQARGSDENILGMTTNLGGAIYANRADLTMINCTVTYSSADDWGGAIYANSGTLNITDSHISHNTAACGAIYANNNCMLSVSSSTLEHNSARYGGAIYAESGDVDITGSRLAQNSANGGGAIHAIDCDVDISGSSIVLNTAQEGGAVMAYGGLDYSYEVSITDSDILQNSATVNGGALFARNYVMDISDSSLCENTAVNGGAVYATSFCQVSITGTSLMKNTAKTNGGAVYACNEKQGSEINGHPAFCTVDVTASTFTQNSAQTGAAVYACNKNSNVALSGDNFTSNGIYISTESDASLHKCILHNSPVAGKSVDLSDCKVINDQPSNVPGKTSGSSNGISPKAVKLTAKKATFKAKAKVKKYTAILKTDKNSPMKKVKLYLKVKGKTYTAKTNSKGKAIFKIKNLKKKGTYKATVTFKGNSNYNKVTKTVKIKVK